MLPPTGKPCKECPFRRASLPGYLGEDAPEAFVYTAMSEQFMPCHLEVDYEDDDWRDGLDEVHQCSGRAIFMTHICKLPRDPALALLPADHKRIFSTPQEFLDHHTRSE